MQESSASTPERIVIEGHFSGFEPAELFTYWTEPEKLVQWWPKVAVVEPRVGGEYAFSWPEMDWHLRGEYTVFDPTGRLGFTWLWDHDPMRENVLRVLLLMDPHPDGGTLLRVEHGPFSAENADDRQGIVEGWLHFGMRLAGLKESSA